MTFCAKLVSILTIGFRDEDVLSTLSGSIQASLCKIQGLFKDF